MSEILLHRFSALIVLHFQTPDNPENHCLRKNYKKFLNFFQKAKSFIKIQHTDIRKQKGGHAHENIDSFRYLFTNFLKRQLQPQKIKI